MAKPGNKETLARMEEKLNRLEHELYCRYSDMGKGLLELARQEQKEVNRLVDEIIATRKKLAQGKRELQCKACQSYNPPDSAYCRRCGARLRDNTDKKENGNADE